MSTRITKENYKQLKWDETITIDDSYDFVQTLNIEERVEYLRFILEKFPQYDDEWVEYYFDISSKWKSQGSWEKFIDFSNFVKEKSPENYKREFCYINEESILHALYHNDLSLVRERFAENIKQPERAIDLTLRSIFNILSIDHSNHSYTKEVAEGVWKSLEVSSELIGGAEFNYSAYLYCSYLEEIFEKISRDEQVDWNTFKEKVENINFKFVETLESLPSIKFEVDKEKFHNNASYREEILPLILIDLMYYSYVETKVPVYWIFRGWFNLVEYCLNEEDTIQKQNWFTFTPKEIDTMGGRLFGTFGGNAEEMFITLWVFPYLYDFFFKREWIDEETYNELMIYYQFTRRELFRISGNYLWRFKGVFSWNKPGFISNEDWKNEKELFEKTIHLTGEDAAKLIEEYCHSLPQLPKHAAPPPPEPSPFERIFEEQKKEKKATNKQNQSRAKSRKKRKKRPKKNKKKR